MRKKWFTLFRKELDTQSFNCPEKTVPYYERAKELYFINFANHTTMKKNGEFKEYCKYHIPKELEYEWSLEVKNRLLGEICSGYNLLQVAQLARVNLPESEIINAFRLLSSSLLRNNILITIQQLEPLFEPSLYKRIVQLFKRQGDCSVSSEKPNN